MTILVLSKAITFLICNSYLKLSIPKNFLSTNIKSMNTFFKEIDELNAQHVHIKNKEEVMNKINVLTKGGVRNLQVVSDYDMTLTKQHENGKKHLSSFGMISVCPSIPKSYIDAEREIYNKYRPIEFDPHIPYDEKLKHMQDWWKASENLLRGITLNPNELEEAARKYEQVLRDGTPDLFKDLNEVEVPILVFSAGLGDTVVAVLKQHNVLYPNVKVISNYLDFDENNTIRGYANEIIHVLNKNEQVIKGTEYYELVKNRGNVIVMGDHIGDAAMADGVPHNTVLKIGFLYERVDEFLPDYMNVFDIVLVDDQTMNIVRAILKPILQK